MLSLIVAMDKNRLIGDNNKLPWHLPEDLKRFKNITMNKPIIMGSNTYRSIGKVLPGRLNLILSKSSSVKLCGIDITLTLNEVKSFINIHKNIEILVIGGSEIYKLLFPLVTKMYITEIHKTFIGDTYFVNYDKSKWLTVESITYFNVNLNCLYKFKVLVKKGII